MKCWGRSSFMQMGDTNSSSRGCANVSGVPTLATPTGLGSGVSDIAISSNTTCALLSDGTVKCWGQESVGQAGSASGSSTSVSSPTTIALGSSFTPASIYGGGPGATHFCALDNSGKAKCWGDGANNKLHYPVHGAQFGFASGSMGDNLPFLQVQ